MQGTSGDTTDEGTGGVRETRREGVGPRLTTGAFTVPEPEGGAGRATRECPTGVEAFGSRCTWSSDALGRETGR